MARLGFVTLACACAVTMTCALPARAQQAPASALPAPAVVHVPTTYGGTAKTAPQFMQSMDYGTPYQTRAELAAHQADVRAARAAQYAAYVHRYGVGRPMRLKRIPASDR